MKLFEILTEAISLTHLKEPLSDALYDAIVSTCNRASDLVYSVPYEVREKTVREVSLSSVASLMAKWIMPILARTASKTITDTLVKKVDVESVKCYFDKIKTSGYAEGTTIVVNEDSLTPIIKEIMEIVFSLTLDNLGSEDEIFDEYFRQFKKIDRRDIKNSTQIDRLIYDVVSTVIHEMVHVKQYDAQHKKGRTRTEYRSYLEKNNKRFYSSLNKIHAGDYTSEDYRLYRASPQEIAAFAHEEALKFINNSDLDSIIDFPDFKKSLPEEIRWYLTDMFKDPTNTQEYKIFKRFNKLMYQEIIRAIEHAEAKQKKEQKRLKAEQERQDREY